MNTKKTLKTLIFLLVILSFAGTASAGAPTFFSEKKIAANKHFSTQPIDAFPIDWDNDGVRDLVLAFNDGTVGYSLNEGSDVTPSHKSVILFQSGGLDLNVLSNGADGMRIWITDWDNDGDRDILVGGDFVVPGDWGSIRIYYNTGNDLDFTDEGHLIIEAKEQWDDWAYPCVIDWDGDGKKDVLICFTNVGGACGAILYLNQNADRDDDGGGAPTFTLADSKNFGDPIGNAAWDWNPAPVVVDWDNDGDWDIVIGASNAPFAFFPPITGKVYIWVNTTNNANPVFAPTPATIITANAANIDVGSARPHVLDLNSDGKKDLLIGSTSGKIYKYLNTGTDDAPVFNNAGPVTNPTYLYKQEDIDIGNNASVKRQDYNNDGVYDLVVGEFGGRIFVYINLGTNILPSFDNPLTVQYDGADLVLVGRAAPCLVDWNNDGKIDLLAGGSDGKLHLFINSSADNNPVFALADYSLVQVGAADLNVGTNAYPAITDWDEDGKKDLVVGSGDGKVYYFNNTGADDAPVFAAPVQLQAGGANIDVGSNSTPQIIDIGNPVDATTDGLKDMVVGNNSGTIYGYINTGLNNNPVFDNQEVILCDGNPIDVGTDSVPFITDWNGDGKPDLIVGSNDGTISRYLNTIGDPEPGVPVVTSITPNTGKNNALIPVTIVGLNFTGATAVKFGDPNNTALLNVVVLDNFTITATVPTGITAGTYSVRVTTPFGTNAFSAQKFEVTLPLIPMVTNVSPNVGMSDEDTPVAITGTNFQGAFNVRLNDPKNTRITGWYVNDAQNIFGGVVPSGVAPGAYDIIVTNAEGSNLFSTVKFYVNSPNPPTVTGVSPQTIVNDVASTITITGSGFLRTIITVALDDINATNLTDWTVNGDTQLSGVVVPSGVTPGQYNVRVTTTAGTNLISTMKLWINSPNQPIVTTILPMSGVNLDATPINIYGSGFGNVSAIHLDDSAHTELKSWTYTNDGMITGAVVPAGLVVGEYNVQITTPAGTNMTSADKFFVNAPDAPVVTEIKPSSAKNDVATPIEIIGTNLVNIRFIRIDNANRTNLPNWTPVNRYLIKNATIPAGLSPGNYNIWVTTTSGTNVISKMKFTVIPSDASITSAAGPSGSSGSGGGGCFLATSAYEKAAVSRSKSAIVKNFTGTFVLPERNLRRLNTLRRFRDDCLMNKPVGRKFVRFYYTLGPVAAEMIRGKEPLKNIVRGWLLRPLSEHSE